MGVSNFVLSAMVCLTIAVHESRQEPILERIKRYAYEENCLKDCNYCRDYTSYESALCGRRIGYEKYNPYKTFPSDCHLRCHNRCNDRNRYDYHYGGVCRREHEYPDHDHYDHDHDHGHDHSHDHGHDHSHYVANQDSRDVHAVIPTCTEAQKCLCSTACEPVCARSPDNPPVYVIFDNLCRLTCTNKCFEDDDHYVRAEPHMCKNSMRDYTCKYNQYG